MHETYIGIDNGVTGTIGIIGSRRTDDGGIKVVEFMNTPVVSRLKYTKTKANITRIDGKKLKRVLSGLIDPFVVMERPLVNPTKFNATTSALRAHEATLIVLEGLDIPHMFVDSKDWQKVMLPKGCSDKELKFASRDIGSRLFPQLDYGKGDADGILITEWARREGL